MGSCFSSEPKAVRAHELAFMSVCTEGAYGKTEILDTILEKAEQEGCVEQIFEAKDDVGDLPIHRAAENGNPDVMTWIFQKWEERGYDLDVDETDHNGYSPLYLVCFKGFLGSEGMVGLTPEILKKRLECVKILLERNANVNFKTDKLEMTPLHWAAYQGDGQMVKLLLDNGAEMCESAVGNTPVDIAGFCGKQNVVLIFAEYLQAKI